VAINEPGSVPTAVDPKLLRVLIGCTAPFLTPIATPPNTIVMGPGGYRFTDYVKLGLPLTAVFFVATVVLVPLIWPF
jgi:di/tricarboxylate transporter